MIERELTIVNRLGLHARAASKLTALAATFPCETRLSYRNREVNAKSILGVMMLAAAPSAVVRLRCVGERADEALEALSALVARGFDEEPA